MHRLPIIILGLALSGCGASPVSTMPSEDSGRRLVGDSGSAAFGGSDGDSADPALADNGDGASADDPPVNPIRDDDPDANGGDAADPSGTGGDTDMTDQDPPFEFPGGLPVGPIEPISPDMVDPFDPFLFDSALLAFIDPELFADFLPFLTDALLLDLLAPSGSSSGGSFADSFSHLELLCLDLDLPRTFCRSRYGN